MNWFRFNATIEEAEALLHTEYKVFSHVETGQPHVACHEYFVPREVRDHIDFITPTVQFDAVVKVRPRKRAEGDLSGRDTTSALPVSGAKPGPECQGKRNCIGELRSNDHTCLPACIVRHPSRGISTVRAIMGLICM
jgi:tripeptidyl-peptidase-1